MRGKILILLLLGVKIPILAVVLGSNTTPSRQTTYYNSFGATGSNYITGFVAIDAGFGLAGASSTVTYTGFYPINGPVNIAGGTLLLAQSLILSSGSTLANGSIAGGGYMLDLPHNISTFSFSVMTLGNITINIHSNTVLAGFLTFTGNSVIEGNGYTLDFSTTGGIRLAANASLALNNVTLLNVDGSNIQCADNTGTFTLNNVTLILSNDYTFSLGKFVVRGECDVTGTHVFAYRSSQTTVIQPNATWFFDFGTTLSYAPLTASKNLIAMSDATSTLHFYTTTLAVTTTGLQLTKGTFVIEGNCPVVSPAKNVNQAIIFGDGVSASNDLHVQTLPGSGLNIMSGFLVNNNVS